MSRSLHQAFQTLQADLSKNPVKYESIFWDFAKFLMQKYQIKAGDDIYDFNEIEFYFNDNKNHKDCYTHCHPLQTRTYCWYVHRGLNNSIKNGNRKGLDITFGSGTNIFGGILIRSIKKVNQIIPGPSLSVDALIYSLQVQNISDFAEKIEQIDIDNSIVKIIDRENSLDKYVYRGTRIGLRGCGPFVNSLYRFAFIEKGSKIKDKEKLAKIAFCKDAREADKIREDLGYLLKVDCQTFIY